MAPFLNNAYFFCRYMIQVTFISNSLQLLAFPTVIVKKFKTFIASNDLDKLYPLIIKKNFDFGYNYSFGCIVFLMILIFSTTIPIIVPFGCLFFYIKYYVDKYNLLFFYPVEFDGVGTLADIVIKLMIFAVFLFQIVLSGLFFVLNDRIDNYITYISIGYMLISVILYFVAGYLFVEDTKKNINKIGNNLLKMESTLKNNEKNKYIIANNIELTTKTENNENNSIKSETTKANTNIPINKSSNVKQEINKVNNNNDLDQINNENSLNYNESSKNLLSSNKKIAATVNTFNKSSTKQSGENNIQSESDSDDSEDDYYNYDKMKELENTKKVSFLKSKKPLKLIKNADINYDNYLGIKGSLKNKLLEDLGFDFNINNQNIEEKAKFESSKNSNIEVNTNDIQQKNLNINVKLNSNNIFELEKFNNEMSSYFYEFYTHPTSKNLKSKTFKDFDYNSDKFAEKSEIENFYLKNKKEIDKEKEIEKLNEEFAIYRLEKGKLVKADVAGIYDDDLFEENT